MLLRRRFSKRVLIISITVALLFYLSTLLFGSIHVPKIFKLTELSRCPACYGVSVCPELYSDQIVLENGLLSLSSYVNAKNIYYGHTKSGVNVVLKKLAHDHELKTFDDNLCNTWDLPPNCKPTDLLNISNSYIDMNIKKSVNYDALPAMGIVFCPRAAGIMDLIKGPKKPRYGKDQSVAEKADMINVWTMLSINPEPIVLQQLPRSEGWRVPKYGGVCGRLMLVSHAGEALSSLPLAQLPWLLRLHYAKQIIDAAVDFTFKHERYRFYIMDWSLDNIVVNERHEITVIDLEDVIILEKNAQPTPSMPDWYKRYFGKGVTSDGEFAFSIQDICTHHLSDLNILGACNILAGPGSQFLHPIPDKYRNITKWLNLLDDCYKGIGDSFDIATSVQAHIERLLQKIGFDPKKA